MARICIDLDGVICEIKQPHQTYADVAVLPNAAEKIRSLRENGHYVIIHTARHMKTCNGNVSQVIKKIGKITLDWLDRHHIEYDEIMFGKPYAHIYIDDNAFLFKDWDANIDQINQVLKEKE